MRVALLLIWLFIGFGVSSRNLPEGGAHETLVALPLVSGSFLLARRVLLVSLARKGPVARAAAMGRVRNRLLTLVVFVLCLGVGGRECNGCMFLPFCFLAPKGLAVSTRPDVLPSLLCLCSLQRGFLRLHAPPLGGGGSHPFSVLMAPSLGLYHQLRTQVSCCLFDISACKANKHFRLTCPQTELLSFPPWLHVLVV